LRWLAAPAPGWTAWAVLRATILFFALLNALPSLPGMSSVLGAPLLLLILPLPLVNIPIGMTLSLLSFGGLRGDGLAVLLGFAAGIASLSLAGSVLWGA